MTWDKNTCFLCGDCAINGYSLLNTEHGKVTSIARGAPICRSCGDQDTFARVERDVLAKLAASNPPEPTIRLTRSQAIASEMALASEID